MRRAVLILLPLLPLLAPPLARAQLETREGIALQNQILQLRQEIEQLRLRGGSTLGAAPVAPPPRGAVPGTAGADLLPRLLDRVSDLEEEVRRLRGRVDEAEFRERQTSEALEKLQGDMDYRLQQLEG
ncbi:MAG TPA: hypothetical protein VE684_07475, partial [Crenalkalicoccus sp.]|nr:hypothetical protein [Crenalkalicoccus sp.]